MVFEVNLTQPRERPAKAAMGQAYEVPLSTSVVLAIVSSSPITVMVVVCPSSGVTLGSVQSIAVESS